MNYTVEYNEGFYFALTKKATLQKCPYKDTTRSTRWIEGYLEGKQAQLDKVCIRGRD